ncbi:MAG: transaldolase [Acidobacteriaceae bacterium]|nr:transaldolase [Acidobacteriaceae bacterium]
MNPLREVQALGQSIWLDYMRRDLVTTGQLQRLMTEDGISGVTSNPTIFERAISAGSEYDSVVEGILRTSPDIDCTTLFERIEVEDIRMAADVLRPVYDQTNGNDGFVSIEVNPHLAYNTAGSISEAYRLWSEVDRPNLMVKIPATIEGLPAIEHLIAEGINVNVTLTFSVSQYCDVAQAYLSGIERARDPRKVASVASFFVSRVDTAVDKALEDVGTSEALALRGKAGIANAKLAYLLFREIFTCDQFQKLKSRGARVQKPLWASTSTKNKAYSDVMYVEGLIGPDTINSVPPETLDAFRHHGRAKVTLPEGLIDAEEVAGRLQAMEINLRSIGMELTEEGVEKFEKSYDELLSSLDNKRKALLNQRAA